MCKPIVLRKLKPHSAVGTKSVILTSGGAVNPGQGPQALNRAVLIMFTTPQVDQHFDVYPCASTVMFIPSLY